MSQPTPSLASIREEKVPGTFRADLLLTMTALSRLPIAVFVAIAFTACGDTDDDNAGSGGTGATGGTGGSAGANTGGSAGANTSGSAGANTGGSAGANTGGSAGANTGGSAGANTGGSAGANTGGSAGAASLDCAGLAKAYKQTLEDAKSCWTAGPWIPCSKIVDSELPCPCPTFTHAQQTIAHAKLTTLKTHWTAKSCQKTVVCPALPCKIPKTGSCTPTGGGGFSGAYSGTCKDNF